MINRVADVVLVGGMVWLWALFAFSSSIPAWWEMFTLALMLMSVAAVVKIGVGTWALVNRRREG